MAAGQYWMGKTSWNTEKVERDFEQQERDNVQQAE